MTDNHQDNSLSTNSQSTLSSHPSSLANQGKALTFKLIASSLLAGLGSFNFGYNLSVVNTTAKSFGYCPTESSVWSCFPVNKHQWGWVAGILCLGAVLGCFVGGPLSNKVGRRYAVLLTNLPYIIGAIVLALAQNVSMLLVGRLIMGIGVGLACVAVPLYLTEISSLGARGLIGSVHQLNITIGIVAGELIALTGLYRPLWWRFMFAFPIIPCLVQILGLFSIAPESPPFLVAHQNKIEEGRTALRSLRGPQHYQEAELQSLLKQKTKDVEGGEGRSWTLVDLLFHRIRISGWSMLIAAVLHLAQQLSGINSVLLFSDSIFNPPSSSSPNDIIMDPLTAPPSLIPVAIAGLNMIMTIVAIAVIDRVGRRVLALSSAGIMALAGFILTMAFFMNWSILSIVAVLCFVGGFSVGLGPVPWLMVGEIFPTEAVGSAVSFAVALNWLTNMTVTTSFPIAADLLKSFAFLPYALCMLVFFLFALFYLPETKGRPVGFI